MKAAAALLLASVAALAALASASAATTPAGYRVQVNGICRTFTPTVKKVIAQLKAAQSAKDPHAYGVALGRLLVLQVAEDVRIERTPVPIAMRSVMTPILTRMKTLDGHARAAIADALARNNSGFMAELTAIERLGKPMNGWLDAAGLRECGSTQS